VETEPWSAHVDRDGLGFDEPLLFELGLRAREGGLAGEAGVFAPFAQVVELDAVAGPQQQRDAYDVDGVSPSAEAVGALDRGLEGLAKIAAGVRFETLEHRTQRRHVELVGRGLLPAGLVRIGHGLEEVIVVVGQSRGTARHRNRSDDALGTHDDGRSVTSRGSDRECVVDEIRSATRGNEVVEGVTENVGVDQHADVGALRLEFRDDGLQQRPIGIADEQPVGLRIKQAVDDRFQRRTVEGRILLH
jgi:hypothetical protein